ncbi:MAG: translation initiation factor IF-2 [Polyangiaceae bacterium]
MSSKVRVYEVAKQLSLDPKAVVALFQAVGINDVRNHMSSVEPEQVERVKRHLEKQRTHDVVEERVRNDGRVIKRRAIAKPAGSGGGPESSARIPTPPASSRHDLSAIAAEQPEQNGNGHVAHLDRDSAPAAPASMKNVEAAIPAPPPSRTSTRELAAAREERKSARNIAAAAASSPALPSVPADRKSTRSVIQEEAPIAAKSSPRMAVEAAAEPAHVEPAAAHVEAAPVEAARQAPSEAPARPTQAPKTGVEYWTGRPGVPMPTPASAQRTAIGGGAAGAMARRVQYDPRAGAGPAARGPQRPGMMQQGRPMMRGGPGGARGGMFRGQPLRRPSGIVSTKEMGADKKVIRIEENITLQVMAQKMSLKSTELLMKLISMGMTGIHINTTLDADTAKILASEFGWEVEDVAVSEEQHLAEARGEDTKETKETKAAKAAKAALDPSAAPSTDVKVDEDMVTRPPVVTVMGHVDHGKTSLLDKIRKANIASGEAGGITQHIGAYKAVTPNGVIVFLDTPGHEAFTQMRARGASGADLVVLVVAADDGVMPQTKEAISHAKAAGVPIIVAVNKIDKPSAEPERVRRELVELGLQPEDWGGDTIFVNVSATTGEGIPQLLEMIALQAEVLDLKANPKKAASGTVLEALLDRGRGPVARILVQDGTLKVGDFVLAGQGFGKVRAMTNEHGKQLHEAPPSTPVEILGLSDVPGAGDPVHAVKDPKKAQEIADSRKGKMAKSLIPATAKVSLEELTTRIADSGVQELRLIIKGDVQGSVEAVADTLAKLSTEKVKLSIVHAGVGAITEGDVNLGIASKALIIGFNVRPAGKASALAEENKIEIRLYQIIYQAIDDVRNAMEGLLPATLVEKMNGKAEVRQVFKIKGQIVAGSYIIEGMFKRNGNARVVREGVGVVFTGKVAALKRFKDDVKDVAEGFECGISLEAFTDLKEKDIIENYDIEEVKQKL